MVSNSQQIIFYVLFYQSEISQKNKIIGNNPNNANLISIRLLILSGVVDQLHSLVKISICHHREVLKLLRMH
jgi:hypothetical protein